LIFFRFLFYPLFFGKYLFAKLKKSGRDSAGPFPGTLRRQLFLLVPCILA